MYRDGCFKSFKKPWNLKNLLLYFPVEFSFEEDDLLSESELLNKIVQALNYDFEFLFEYRNYIAEKFDTYLITIYSEPFYLFRVERNVL